MTHKISKSCTHLWVQKQTLIHSQTDRFSKAVLSESLPDHSIVEVSFFDRFYSLLGAAIKVVLTQLFNLSVSRVSACSLKPQFPTTKSTIL